MFHTISSSINHFFRAMLVTTECFSPMCATMDFTIHGISIRFNFTKVLLMKAGPKYKWSLEAPFYVSIDFAENEGLLAIWSECSSHIACSITLCELWTLKPLIKLTIRPRRTFKISCPARGSANGVFHWHFLACKITQASRQIRTKKNQILGST